MKAVVMAGGFGSRIQPLTNAVPKPMLPIVNRPMMEHIILKLKDVGIKEFVILLYFKPEVIKEYFKDGKDFGIKITYVLPDDDYGTAGAVKCAQKYLKDDNFIIVSGDLVTDFDFQKIIDFHKEKKAKLSITLTPVDNPLQFGVVITNKENRIEKFLEKPSWGEVFSDTINTGIYILEPEILSYIPEEKNFDFSKDLFPKLMDSGVELWGATVNGYWRDVGNPQSYRDVYEDILNSKTLIKFRGKKQIFGAGVLYSEDESLKVDSSVDIRGVVAVGKNVTIGKDVELDNVVVGDNCTIEAKAKVENSVIWDSVLIESKANLNNCVICNDNRIGKKVRAKVGLILAEHCEVDRFTIFEKDVIVWPDKIIDESSIVSNNIIWGSKYKNSIFEDGSVIGRTNIELSCEMATKLAESFGSILPIGSKVYVSRDYHKSSRMLKRAFLGGLLSTGIDVIDLQLMPSSVMRYNLGKNEDTVAGVHFRQSISDQINTQILFFTNEGLNIDTNTSKNIERIFFRENFRRVNYQEIGEISVASDLEDNYKRRVLDSLNTELIKQKDVKMAIDLMFGSTSRVYPDLINELDIENVVLNAYLDDKKLSKLPNLIKKSKQDVSNIVKSLNLGLGFLVYPNGQRLDIICERGSVIDRHISLLLVLSLMNFDKSKKSKIFLPAWAPDFMDKKFKNLDIERGKFTNFKASKLKEYDLVANTDGGFAFVDFSLNNDSMFASLKILEMMLINDVKVSELLNMIDDFYYLSTEISCPSSLKGKMMRKFLEDSKDKEASHLDGVKIWTAKNDWILMIPNQYSDSLNIYIQAKNRKAGEALLADYSKKIDGWIKE